MKMPFLDIDDLPRFEPLPGCRLRTPHGENLMLSHVEMDEGAEIPAHQHPHEQGGVVLKGQLEFTIGDEVRIISEGQMYLIPPNTPHKAIAVNGPAIAMDVFSPIREDYVEQMKNASQTS